MLPLRLLSAAASAVPDTVQMRAGLVLTRSTVLRPAARPLQADGTDSVVIRVRAGDIVLDADGAALNGSELGTAPDQRTGYGALIEGGRNVTIRRAGIPAERFAVEAIAAVERPEGVYEVAAASDVVDRAPLQSGKHRLRVAYCQVDGWVELRLEIRRP